jgi:hypothetical protein
MVQMLVAAAVRSLVLAAAVWLGLRLPVLRNRHIQLAAWTTVLAASLLMPLAMRVMAVTMPAAVVIPADVALIFSPGSGAPPAQDADAALDEGRATVTDARPAVMPEPRRGAGAATPWLRSLASLLYLLVSGFLLIRLMAGLLLAARVVRAAKPVHDSWTSGYDVRVSRAIGSPATFGSVILLPYDYTAWSPVKLTAVLSHEAAHVRRHDFHLQVAASLNRAIFWFNPLSWWLRRKLSELAEAASDDAALLELHDRPVYAEILLEVSSAAPVLPGGVAMARPATVRARIDRVLAETAVPAFASTRCCKMVMTGLLPLVVMAAGPLAISRIAPMLDDKNEQSPYQRIAIDPKLLDADAGFYEDMTGRSLMIVTRAGDHLITGRMGRRTYVEYPYTDHDFFLTETPQQNHFVTDASGNVIRVVHRYNGLATIFERISADTARRIQTDYDRHLAEELQPHTPVKLDPEALQDFVGYYQLAPTLILHVTREADQLFVESTIQRPSPIFPYGALDFFYTSCAAQITFIKPQSGQATALVFHENGKDRTARRVGTDVVEQLQRRLDDERKPHAAVSIDPDRLDLYAGRYGNPQITMTIVHSGDHLIAKVLGFDEYAVHPYADDKYAVYPYTDRDFFATAAPEQISFITDAQGKIVQLVRHRGGENLVLRRLGQTECSWDAETAQCSQ